MLNIPIKDYVRLKFQTFQVAIASILIWSGLFWFGYNCLMIDVFNLPLITYTQVVSGFFIVYTVKAVFKE